MWNALILLSVLVVGRAAGPVAEKADVCEVAKSGARFAGHFLELTGTILGQDTEHLLLTSPDCALGVRLTFAPEVRQQDDVLILLAAIKRNAAIPGRAVTGTLEGTYVYADDHSSVGLRVSGVDHLNFPKK